MRIRGKKAVKPMISYIKNSLSTGEEVVAYFPIHWFYWAQMLTGMILISTIVVAVLSMFSIYAALVMLLISLVIIGYKILVYRGIERGVTNKRVITKTGIISRNSEEMKLTSIETVEIKQTVIDRIFNCGTVRITGRGESLLFLEKVDNPLQAKKTIESIAPQE